MGCKSHSLYMHTAVVCRSYSYSRVSYRAVPTRIYHDPTNWWRSAVLYQTRAASSETARCVCMSSRMPHSLIMAQNYCCCSLAPPAGATGVFFALQYTNRWSKYIPWFGTNICISIYRAAYSSGQGNARGVYVYAYPIKYSRRHSERFNYIDTTLLIRILLAVCCCWLMWWCIMVSWFSPDKRHAESVLFYCSSFFLSYFVPFVIFAFIFCCPPKKQFVTQIRGTKTVHYPPSPQLQ